MQTFLLSSLVMGLSCQKSKSRYIQQTSLFLQSIKYHSVIQHPHFGLINIYSLKEEFIAQLCYFFTTKQLLEKKIALLRILSRSQQCISTIYHIYPEKKVTCSHNYLLTVYKNHYNYTLENYLDKNRKKKTLMDSGEIWYILKAIVLLGAQLQQRNLILKQLDASKIWVSPQYTLRIDIDQIEHIDDMVEQITKNSLLLSPEQIAFRSLKDNRFFHFNYTFKNRVFSLGMLILECYTNLQSSITYYNYIQNAIDAVSLNRDIKQVSDKHLASLLSRMLQIIPQKRIDFLQLKNLVMICEEYEYIRDALNIA